LPPSTPTGKNIVQLAAATPDLSTLVDALGAGQLIDTLKGPGPFTVFAPTNEAFAKLPAGTLESLLKPENHQQLVDILTYHVVAGTAAFAKDLTDGEQIKTVEGKDVTAHVSSAGVKINGATVTTADVAATNGVVHIIDQVLLPPSTPTGKNIVQLAAATADLSTLVTAVKAGGLVDTLSGTGPFTVFAPTNEAFAKLPKATLDYLLAPANKAKLVDVLTYHVAAGSVHAADLTNGEKITTVEGKQVEARIFGSKGEYVFINNARVTTADVDASNGVVHIIDTVLIPPEIEAEAADVQTE